MGGAVIVIWIIWTIAAFVFLCRKYSGNIIGILLVSSAWGWLLTWLTIKWWYIAAIIVIVIGLAASSNSENKTALGVAVVLAVVISVMGIHYKNGSDDSDKNQEKQQYETTQAVTTTVSERSLEGYGQ